MLVMLLCFFFKQKTAYEMRISDWSSDVCSSDLRHRRLRVCAEHLWLVCFRIIASLGYVANEPASDPMVSAQPRSEERRVGKECVSTCRSRWTPYHQKKNNGQSPTLRQRIKLPVKITSLA